MLGVLVAVGCTAALTAGVVATVTNANDGPTLTDEVVWSDQLEARFDDIEHRLAIIEYEKAVAEREGE
jgi:hypothetical protein